MVKVTILMSIVHLIVAEVLWLLDEFSMCSLHVNAWVVLELSIVVNRADIIRLLVVGMIIHRIVLVVVVEPVLEDRIFF